MRFPAFAVLFFGVVSFAVQVDVVRGEKKDFWGNTRDTPTPQTTPQPTEYVPEVRKGGLEEDADYWETLLASMSTGPGVLAPTASPSTAPAPTPSPAGPGVLSPTTSPSGSPSQGPTPNPTARPTPNPTPQPSPSPTASPTPQPTGVCLVQVSIYCRYSEWNLSKHNIESHNLFHL